MKVPIRYKSSDRYNAGVDVVYDDESKLQYAPFIYATTASSDNGGDGEDEEGEDSMVVIFDNATKTINKSFKELKDAVDAGKIVMLKTDLGNGTDFTSKFSYLINIEYAHEDVVPYKAYFASAVEDPEGFKLSVLQLDATSETNNMKKAIE